MNWSFLKQNRVILELILIGVLGMFLVRPIVSNLALNLTQIQTTRVLAISNVYRGSECKPSVPDWTRRLLAIADALNPNDSRLNLRWGTLDWLEGNCESALAFWQASVSENTVTSQWASIALVRGLLWMRMHDAAVEIARQAKLESYFYRLGYSREIAGDVPAAIEFYSLALEVRPSYAAASRLAQIFIGQKDTQAERELWTRMSLVAPRGELLHEVAIARIAALKSDWDTLFDSTQRAAAMSQDTQLGFDLYLRLGRALERGQQKERARVAFEQAIEIAPTVSSEPYTSLAQFYMSEKNYAKASELIDRAITLFPGDPWPHIYSGNLSALLGNLPEAEQQFNAAFAISPRHLGASFYYATILHQNGQSSRALLILENAVNQDCATLILLAELYRTVGDRANADSTSQHRAQNCK